MNCRTCQYELSQCLDGRLPSGRRAVVMEHTEGCTACAQFYEELQAAQKLVLRLPRARVGPEFREQLFERLATGEGTPMAVFNEAVPVATKIRYLVTGAAAAAAVVVCLTWVNRDGMRDVEVARVASEAGLSRPAADTGSNPSLPAQPLVASTGNAAMWARLSNSGGGASASPLEPRPRMMPRPLTPELLAIEAARRVENGYNATSNYVQMLDHTAGGELIARRACDEAADVRMCAAVLLDLNRLSWVEFGPDVAADLMVAVKLLDEDQLRQRSLFVVRNVVAPALQKSQRLAELSRQFFVRPQTSDDDRQVHMVDIAREWSDAIQRLFFFLPSTSMAGDFDPRNLTFTIGISSGDNCPPILVTPRRDLRR